MTLKALITKLQGKPNQDAEVEFLVFEKGKGATVVCCDLSGPATHDLMELLAKKNKQRTEVA